MPRLVLAAVLLVVSAGCGGGGGDERPTVVAGFYPLAWAAEQVGGDAYNVVNLTPPGAEPHDLELSPRDVERIDDAALVVLVVLVGGGFQPALEDAAAEREGPTLDVLPAGERDPHVWLDPQRFAGILRDLAERVRAGPEIAAVIERVSALDAEYRRGLRECESRVLVTTHAAFGHLADRYDLAQLSLAGSSPEAEPSPRELERLIDTVRETGATTVFAEPLVSDRVAQTVAREVGAEVAVLDPLEGLSDERLDAGEDYLSVMRDNLAALRKALGCR
jgi:zinc transport system substrate-binding protein